MPSFLPDDVKSLISRMLCMDPNQRITIHEIKKHPWWKRMVKSEKLKVIVPPLQPASPVKSSTPDKVFEQQRPRSPSVSPSIQINPVKAEIVDLEAYVSFE